MFRRKTKDKNKTKLTSNTWAQLRKFNKFFKPSRGLFIIGWIFLVLSSITAVVFPTLMGQLVGQKDGQAPVIDVPGVDLNDLSVLLFSLFIVFAFQAFFSFFRIFIFNVVTERTLLAVKSTLFSKLISLPKTYFDKNDSGDLVSRVSNDVQLIQTTLNTTIAEFFRQILTVLVAIVAIFYFSHELAFWMLSVVPVLAIVALFFGRFVRKLSKSAQDFNAKSNSLMQVALSGIVNVKAFNNERVEEKQYQDNMTKVKNISIKSGLVRGLFVSFIIFCLFGGISFVIWKAKMLEADGFITNAQFVTFIFYTVMLGTSFASLPELYSNIQKSLGATEQVMDIIDLEDESDNTGADNVNFQDKIEFKKVDFAYPTRKDSLVLNNASLTLKKNQHIGIVGESGGGKSTIAALLLGLYNEMEGQILIDGISIHDLNLKSLRDIIGYVPQDIQLFNGTIRENIGYGNTNATEEEVEKAATMACVKLFTDEFNEGLDTIVGERGVQLSGGQRQRIAIARAILKNPQILVFDEATSALDNTTEFAVQKALESFFKERTVITIAHRLTTIKDCDQIIVMEHGSVKESGNHADLMKHEDGLYKKLYEKRLTEVGA